MGSGPLHGIRVVEFAGIGPGPFAAMLLSDMGAEVVRVVRPGTQPVAAADFVARGRRQIALDLRAAQGRQDAMALLEHADALLEGFRPGVMERNGLGPEEVALRNPRLVYGRMTGWGQQGPLAASAGHDINYISLTGALSAIGTPETPVPPLNLAGDYGGGALYLAVGVLAALLEARTSARGQVVDAAMCDGALSLMTPFYALLQQGRWQEQRSTNLLDGGAHFYSVYRCRDGGHLAVGPIEPQFYAIFRDKLDLADPLFDRQRDPAAWPEQKARIAERFMTRTRDEWCAAFAGTDGCVTPVLQMSESPLHPHLMARASFAEHEGLRQPAPAPRFSRTPSAIQPTAPDTTAEELISHWRHAGTAA